VEERWDHEGQRWYCREMIRADVVDDRIVELSVYYTGDWDEAKQREHAAAVSLIRPGPAPGEPANARCNATVGGNHRPPWPPT